MIFPIGDTQVQGGAKPIFSYLFIGLNVLIFIFQVSLGSGAQQFVQHFGAIPLEITNMEDLFTLGTSIFLHGGIAHLFGNMLYLWIFADNIESTIGNFQFVIFYLMGGLIASLAHVFCSPMSTIPTVGASGAISAVMGAYLVMFPKSKIKMIFLIFFRRPFYISAMLFLGFWIFEQIFGVFQPSDPNQGGIAWWAHIGGFVFGVACAYIFFKKSVLPEYNSESENDLV